MSDLTPFSERPFGTTPPPPPPDPTLIIFDPVSRCASEACNPYWTNCGVFNSPQNYSPTVPGVFPYGPDPATGTGCVGRYHIVGGTDERSPFQYGKNWVSPSNGVRELYAEFELRRAAGTSFCAQKIFRIGDQSGSFPNVTQLGMTVGQIFANAPAVGDIWFQNFNRDVYWPEDTWVRHGFWGKQGTFNTPDGAMCFFANDVQFSGRRDLVLNLDASDNGKWTFFWILANYSFGSGLCCTPPQPTACSNGDIFVRNIRIYSGKPNYVP